MASRFIKNHAYYSTCIVTHINVKKLTIIKTAKGQCLKGYIA